MALYHPFKQTNNQNNASWAPHRSLLVQVGLVSNQHHGEVISVLDPQNLGVELLDLIVTRDRREEKENSYREREGF